MKRYILIGLVTFAVGFVTARLLVKPEERIVYREVKIKDTVKVTDEKKVITKRPDGTVVTEIDRHTRTDSHTEKNVTAFKNTQRDWSLGLYGNSSHALVTLDRRVLGDVYVGLYLRTEIADPKRIDYGVGVRINF